eukprot:14766_1
MGGIEGGNFGLILGKDRIGDGGGHGEDGVRVEGVQFLPIFLNFRLFSLEMVLSFDVFGIVFGDDEGLGGGRCAGWRRRGGGGERSCGELQGGGDGALGS